MINKILKSREELQHIRKGMGEYNALIQFSINMPGENKTVYPHGILFTIGIHEVTKVLMENQITIKDIKYELGFAGHIAFFALDYDALSVKKLFVKLENEHALGKYWDIDAFDRLNVKISRQEAGAGSRKCFLCSKAAKECAAFQKHSYEELHEKIIADVKSFLYCR